MKVQHIRPYSISAEAVFQLLGQTVCPYCGKHVADDLAKDIGWIEGPIIRIPPRFICLGCCEDIYSTCAADDFATHPYRDIVVDAARIEGAEKGTGPFISTSN